MTLDENSNIFSAQDYYPYGEVLRSYTLGSGANDKYKFTEKERDTETNYDYFGARYYDSELARWTTIDPLADKFPGWSPYNYTLNNPLKYVDPDGREAVKADPDDPEENRFAGKPINNTPKDLSADNYKLGDKNAVEITKDASNRVSAIGNAIDKNAPKVLNSLSLVLLPVAPQASLVLSTFATAWTAKNDLNTGDFDNSAVSILTTTLSMSKSEAVIYGAQGTQVLYDFGCFQKSEIPKSIQKEINGTNFKEQIERYRKLGNYGF
ncbi:MAG: RHS repeat-associated core domain-containing protein [Ignavibacterium sp.]|nr:RHS repeat-associated core domain-containing protein [Ignavibacterium sp.]